MHFSKKVQGGNKGKYKSKKNRIECLRVGGSCSAVITPLQLRRVAKLEHFRNLGDIHRLVFKRSPPAKKLQISKRL